MRTGSSLPPQTSTGWSLKDRAFSRYTRPTWIRQTRYSGSSRQPFEADARQRLEIGFYAPTEMLYSNLLSIHLLELLILKDYTGDAGASNLYSTWRRPKMLRIKKDFEIEESALLVLDDEDYERFCQDVATPPQLSPELIELAQKRRRWK